MDVACDLFAKKGYNAASVEEMAAASKCSKANIYYHFRSKEDLFLHISELYEREWYDNWEKLKSSFDTVSDQLFGVLEFSTKQGLSHPLYKAACEFMDDYAVSSSAVTAANSVKAAIAAKIEKNRLFYEQLFEEGIASGEFRAGNAKQYGVILEGMLRGIGETTTGMDPLEALEMYRAAIHVLLHGIASER